VQISKTTQIAPSIRMAVIQPLKLPGANDIIGFRPSADDIGKRCGGLCADSPAAKVRVFPATKAPVPMFRCRYGIVGRHAPHRGDIGAFGMRQRLTCRWCDRKQYADDQGAAQGMDIHARLHTSEIRPVVHRRTSSLAAPFLLAYSGLYVGA
jgi:hypothetical protein